MRSYGVGITAGDLIKAGKKSIVGEVSSFIHGLEGYN